MAQDSRDQDLERSKQLWYFDFHPVLGITTILPLCNNVIAQNNHHFEEISDHQVDILSNIHKQYLASRLKSVLVSTICLAIATRLGWPFITQFSESENIKIRNCVIMMNFLAREVLLSWISITTWESGNRRILPNRNRHEKLITLPYPQFTNRSWFSLCTCVGFVV